MLYLVIFYVVCAVLFGMLTVNIVHKADIEGINSKKDAYGLAVSLSVFWVVALTVISVASLFVEKSEESEEDISE